MNLLPLSCVPSEECGGGSARPHQRSHSDTTLATSASGRRYRASVGPLPPASLQQAAELSQHCQHAPRPPINKHGYTTNQTSPCSVNTTSQHRQLESQQMQNYYWSQPIKPSKPTRRSATDHLLPTLLPCVNNDAWTGTIIVRQSCCLTL